jgi:hypothetical protein
MKPPLMMSTYVCGECGIQMLMDRPKPESLRATTKSQRITCHTADCAQRGETFTVLLAEALVATEASDG